MEDAWITPRGEVIKVSDFGHDDYARDLLRCEMGFKGLRKYLDENKYNLRHPYEVLHHRGWVRLKSNHYKPKIRLLGSCIDLTKPMRNTLGPAMNNAQLKVAKRICEENNVILHEAINDKRFW